MVKEFEESLGILERILPRDKEIILLSAVFFWVKYKRRKINTDGFEPDILDVDFNDPISILRAGFDLHRQLNSDVEGDIVGAVTDILSKYPMRIAYFPHLNKNRISSICSILNDIFENQEFCAQCESWSYYDSGLEDFTINATDTMLYLRGNYIGLSWFSNIHEWRNRQLIIKAILKERLINNANGLLLFGDSIEGST